MAQVDPAVPAGLLASDAPDIVTLRPLGLPLLSAHTPVVTLYDDMSNQACNP